MKIGASINVFSHQTHTEMRCYAGRATEIRLEHGMEAATKTIHSRSGGYCQTVSSRKGLEIFRSTDFANLIKRNESRPCGRKC